jgi:hypothetical protein
VTTYPLQPVQAGAAPDLGDASTPGRWGLILVALLGLGALVGRGRWPKLPKLRRPN